MSTWLHYSFAFTFHISLDFQANYKLDVPSLCTDFQEDIEFHFTLGWQAILRKFLAPHNAGLAIALGANVRTQTGIKMCTRYIRCWEKGLLFIAFVFNSQLAQKSALNDNWLDLKVLKLRWENGLLLFQIQRNVQSLVPTAQHNTQEGRPGASAQTCPSRDVMRRYEGDDVTLAVIQGLASLTSRTGTLVVIVGGLVRV